MLKTPTQSMKEIKTDEYTLLYKETDGVFVCSECNQEHTGLHMEHSIFFEKYTDTAPICTNCVQEHYQEHS